MKTQKFLGDILTYILVLIGILIFTGPFIWMVSTSLKLPADQYTHNLIPNPITAVNYVNLRNLGGRGPATTCNHWSLHAVCVGLR